MAQVQQANVTPLSNGVVTSENGATVNGIDVEIQNGNTSPTKDAYGASSSHDIDEQVQLSPASLRRRSTRASALKAQEKIKLKDDVVQSKPKTDEGENGQDTETGDEEAPEEDVPPKKRKLDDGTGLDQFCFRFGLRTNDDGDVYAMTDESENSSIHSSEMAVIHAHHEKMLSREMTAEQLNERIMMRKEAESQLRIEEAKLALLKRMKQSQTCAIQKLTEAKKMTANLPNLNSTAYKPIFAPPLNKSSTTTTSNGKPGTPQQKNAALLALAGMTPQQQHELLARLAQSSTAAQQALQQSKKSGNNAQVQQMLTQLILSAQQQMKDKEKPSSSSNAHVNGTGNIAASSSSSSLAAAQTAAANSLSQAQAKLMASQTPQQRSLAARMAFRAQADKQLMMVSAPKAPPPDMFFIPNPSQPAFTYLLGLDLVVSRVLKDKTLDKKYTEEPYECEECHTDFTPSWKAIGSSPDELHLYCEQCVRTAQKRKIRLDHSNFLKKAYQKISTQEKEFEKKIAEGTLEQVLEQSRPSVAAPIATASTSSATAPAVNRLTQNSSGSGTSTPKSSTPATSSTPKASSSSSNAKKTPNVQQINNALLQQFMNSPMAAGMRNPTMMQQMMKLSSMMQAQAQQVARNVNMPNIPNVTQIMQLMAQQQQAQQQQQNNSSAAAAAAAAAAVAAQQQQQQQQMAAIAALMSGAGGNAAGLMNPNVNMMLQHLSAAQQKQFFEALRGSKK